LERERPGGSFLGEECKNKRKKKEVEGPHLTEREEEDGVLRRRPGISLGQLGEGESATSGKNSFFLFTMKKEEIRRRS